MPVSGSGRGYISLWMSTTFEGDLMPDGEFSMSSYDSEVDDPSTFPEFDDDEDGDEVQQLVETTSRFVGPNGSTTARTVVAQAGDAHSASSARKSTHDENILSDRSARPRSLSCRRWACSMTSSMSCRFRVL